MATKKISELTRATDAPSASSLIPVVTGGVTHYMHTRDVHGMGWEFHIGSVYTTSNRLVVDGSRGKILNDGLGVGSTTAEASEQGLLWDTANSVMKHKHVGDLPYICIGGMYEVSSPNSWFNIAIDIVGFGNVSNEMVYFRDQNTPFQKIFCGPFPAGSPFEVNNGVEFYIDTEASGDRVECWDFTMFIAPMYRAKV